MRTPSTANPQWCGLPVRGFAVVGCVPAVGLEILTAGSGARVRRLPLEGEQDLGGATQLVVPVGRLRQRDRHQLREPDLAEALDELAKAVVALAHDGGRVGQVRAS